MLTRIAMSAGTLSRPSAQHVALVDKRREDDASGVG
jgi:hypothetical protein